MLDPSEEYMAVDYAGTSSKLKQVFASRRARRRKATANVQDFNGSRRTLSLLPAPMESSGKEIVKTNSVSFHQLLIKIEGNQCSGCIQVFSQKTRSRSAILVFRGRVLGCVYGQRNLGYQVFGQEALDNALTDLAGFDNQLLAYQLPEEIVLAAASLFQGNVLQFTQANNVEETYYQAIHSLMNATAPGCVVIGDNDNEMVNVAYVANGQVIGLYSNIDGWLDTSLVRSLVKSDKFQAASVSASILAANSSTEAYRLGLSLTGLGESRYAHPSDNEDVTRRRIEQRKSTSRTSARASFNHKLAHVRALPAMRLPVAAKQQGAYSGFHASGQLKPMRHAHLIHP
jgi:hypothetical protein